LKEQLGDKQAKVCGGLPRASLSHRSNRTGEFANYLAMKKLKKAALGYIATNLTRAEVGTLEDLFRVIDKNGTGTISLTELDEAIAQGNFNEHMIHDVRKLRHDLELSDDTKLKYRDFVAVTMDRSLAMREDNMRMAFEHFRHTDADHLTVADLADIFGGEAQAQEVMDILDTDGDGKVSYEDFRHAIVESMEDESDHDMIS
jgi:calcium-dependent protein kinase